MAAAAPPAASREPRLGAALLLGVYVIWTASHPSGQGAQRRCRRSSEVGRGRLGRARSCFVLGRRAAPEVRAAWMWTGAFATLWAIGEGVFTYYTFVGSGAVPFPSLADAAFLAACPSLAVGILWFPSVHRHGVFRARLPLEGTIVGRLAADRELDDCARYRLPLRLGQRLLSDGGARLPDQRCDHRHGGSEPCSARAAAGSARPLPSSWPAWSAWPSPTAALPTSRTRLSATAPSSTPAGSPDGC